MQINLARCRILFQKSNEVWHYNKLSIQGSKNIFLKVIIKKWPVTAPGSQGVIGA
jgi:hypothetical protein